MDHDDRTEQRERDDVLRELTASRVALGAALGANARALELGRTVPCDAAAIASLTRSVLDALVSARAIGTALDMSVQDALTFYVDEPDGQQLRVHTATTLTDLDRHRLLAPIVGGGRDPDPDVAVGVLAP